MAAQPPPLSYHEKVARVMSRSIMVGAFNDYGTILAALVRTFPLEADLRRHVEELESKLRVMCIVPDNFHFADVLDDDD